MKKVKELNQDIKRIKENTYKSCLQELMSQITKNDLLKSALKRRIKLAQNVANH